jgi:hypothetical protein
MLTANVGWIFIIQVMLSVVILLWGYNRYAKRWGTNSGHDSVDGTYTRVDYIASEIPGFTITYGYTVNDRRYFGSINQLLLSSDLSLSIEENTEMLKKEYLTGRTVKVFYRKEFPSIHSLNFPPGVPFFDVIGIPMLILILSNIPLLFIDYLIVSSPYN